MMKKIALIIINILFVGNLLTLAKALEYDEASHIENNCFVELTQIDLSSHEIRKVFVNLPNNKKGYIIVEDIPVINTMADHLTLQGSFNKRLTFTESSPLMTTSAIFF